MKFLLVSICLLCAFVAQAEVYKWVDKDGLVHYSDSKPEDETIDAKEFLGSPIQINKKGLVVQANQKPAPTAPQPEIKTEVTFAGLLAAAKAYVYGLLDSKPQIAKPKESLSIADSTRVISNDNMGEVLEQIAQEKRAQQEKAEALANPRVEIFTAPWCGYCKKAIAYLELNKIQYIEYDVSTNSSAALRQQMLGGGNGIPFAVVNGEKIRGWSQQAYAKALGL